MIVRVVVVIAALTICGLCWLGYTVTTQVRAHGAYRSQLMAQCLADGNKEYECWSMVYGRRGR
jgi:hypothetical protein